MNYPEQVVTKLPKVGTTIFTTMSALAQEHEAINLSQGFPDFEIDPKLAEMVEKAMKDGLNQYAPMAGNLQLREAIADQYVKDFERVYNVETEITVTAGATEAIFCAITALIKEGDEVMMFTPAYDCYEPAIELNGGKAMHIPLHAPDFKIDWELVKSRISRKTKMMIINTPHNPTGTIWSADDVEELKRIVDGKDIIILSDEVYGQIVFDDQPHCSMASAKELAQRSIIVGSFGKTFHVTGWKVGYAVAPANLMKEFKKVHQYVTFAVNHPMQAALAQYMRTIQDSHQISNMYQKKRDLFRDGLAESKFKLLPCQGTYFQLLDYSNLSDDVDVNYAIELIQQHQIAAIPVSVFYHNPVHEKVLRFCFAKKDDTLIKAAEILSSL